MIIWIMGILLIASFICFVIYAMKGGNLTIGFFILTIVWTLVYFLGIPFGIGKPFDVIEETFAQPALTYGSTIIQIICGAWFGRVLVDTGIAASISYRTAKVGEKSPVLATMHGSGHLFDFYQCVWGGFRHSHRRDPVPDSWSSRCPQTYRGTGIHPLHRCGNVDQ